MRCSARRWISEVPSTTSRPQTPSNTGSATAPAQASVFPKSVRATKLCRPDAIDPLHRTHQTRPV
ncbi:hypothetical protein BS17DRAFT_772559 [Gyrodon lividus]|nr:hypothetical protein BS17DRAFT_772559 [Gyrodon lividus]